MIYKKKLLSIPFNNNGFSLIELIVVIIIIGVLASIITPSVLGYISKAKENVLNSNMSDFAKVVSIYSIDYDKSDWYGDWKQDGDGTLNNFIELEIEKVNNGTYENNVSMANPYSKKKSILDFNRTLSSGDGYCPAVFLTANTSYSYTGTGNTENLIGTIVAYFKVNGNTTEHIEVYYVSYDGTKSNHSISIN